MSELIERLKFIREKRADVGYYCHADELQIFDEAIAALSVAPAPVAAYTEFMIERLNIALDHIRNGVPHMASACLLADISRLKADLQEPTSPPVQEGPKGVEPALTPDLVESWDDAWHEKYGGGMKMQPKLTYFIAQQAAVWARQHLQQSSPAQSIPAAIDEEGREALKEAIGNFREDMSDLHPQSSLLPIYRKHIAALERLLSGN